MSDRPSSQGSHTSSEPNQPKSTTGLVRKSSRTVSFSVYSDLVIILVDNRKTNRSYSRNDIRRFQQEMLNDVQRLRQELATPPQHISQDRIYECVGLEKFLSQALHTRTSAAIRAHMDAVLEEQDLQEQRGVCDKEALASRSEATSGWARGGAQAIAAGYFRMRN